MLLSSLAADHAPFMAIDEYEEASSTSPTSSAASFASTAVDDQPVSLATPTASPAPSLPSSFPSSSDSSPVSSPSSTTNPSPSSPPVASLAPPPTASSDPLPSNIHLDSAALLATRRPPAEDDCCVCFNGDSEENDPILFCDGPGCTAVVHQSCYGVLSIPEGDWLCDSCALKVNPALAADTPLLLKNLNRCMLCPDTTGAFKPTADGRGWVHASCAIWTPETGFRDAEKVDAVIGIETIDRRRWRLVCEICRVKQGSCVQCMGRQCSFSCHVTCGWKAGLRMEMQAVGAGDELEVYKLVYCDKHRNEPWQKASGRWGRGRQRAVRPNDESDLNGGASGVGVNSGYQCVRCGSRRRRHECKREDLDETMEVEEEEEGEDSELLRLWEERNERETFEERMEREEEERDMERVWESERQNLEREKEEKRRQADLQCFDINTEVLIRFDWPGEPRVTWMNAKTVMHCWRQPAMRAVMQIASLRCDAAGEQAERQRRLQRSDLNAASSVSGSLDRLVYARLTDVVAPFVYDSKQRYAGRHPIRIRAQTSKHGAIDLLVTPDHNMWVAPQRVAETVMDNGTSSFTCITYPYQQVTADQLLVNPLLHLVPRFDPQSNATRTLLDLQCAGWRVKQSAPVDIAHDYSFRLPSMAEMIQLAAAKNINLAEHIPLEHLHNAAAFPAHTFYGADMDTFLAFLGMHCTDGSVQMGVTRSRCWLSSSPKKHTAFIDGVWTRLARIKRSDGSLLFPNESIKKWRHRRASSSASTSTSAAVDVDDDESRDREPIDITVSSDSDMDDELASWDTEEDDENNDCSNCQYHWSVPQLVVWLFIVNLHTSKQRVYEPLPSWVWLLSPRQVTILLMGMAHGDGTHNDHASLCDWCGIIHNELDDIRTHNKQHAEELHALAMHAGMYSTVRVYHSDHLIGSLIHESSRDCYKVTIHQRANPSVCTGSVDAGSNAYVHIDDRPATRQRLFWCVTTEEPSHVVLVSRRVDDFDERYPNPLARPQRTHDGYVEGEQWVTAWVGNCKHDRERRDKEREERLARGEVSLYEELRLAQEEAEEKYALGDGLDRERPVTATKRRKRREQSTGAAVDGEWKEEKKEAPTSTSDSKEEDSNAGEEVARKKRIGRPAGSMTRVRKCLHHRALKERCDRDCPFRPPPFTEAELRIKAEQRERHRAKGGKREVRRKMEDAMRMTTSAPRQRKVIRGDINVQMGSGQQPEEKKEAPSTPSSAASSPTSALSNLPSTASVPLSSLNALPPPPFAHPVAPSAVVSNPIAAPPAPVLPPLATSAALIVPRPNAPYVYNTRDGPELSRRIQSLLTATTPDQQRLQLKQLLSDSPPPYCKVAIQRLRDQKAEAVLLHWLREGREHKAWALIQEVLSALVRLVTPNWDEKVAAGVVQEVLTHREGVSEGCKKEANAVWKRLVEIGWVKEANKAEVKSRDAFTMALQAGQLNGVLVNSAAVNGGGGVSNDKRTKVVKLPAFTNGDNNINNSIPPPTSRLPPIPTTAGPHPPKQTSNAARAVVGMTSERYRQKALQEEVEKRAKEAERKREREYQAGLAAQAYQSQFLQAHSHTQPSQQQHVNGGWSAPLQPPSQPSHMQPAGVDPLAALGALTGQLFASSSPTLISSMPSSLSSSASTHPPSPPAAAQTQMADALQAAAMLQAQLQQRQGGLGAFAGLQALDELIRNGSLHTKR